MSIRSIISSPQAVFITHILAVFKGALIVLLLFSMSGKMLQPFSPTCLLFSGYIMKCYEFNIIEPFNIIHNVVPLPW